MALTTYCAPENSRPDIGLTLESIGWTLLLTSIVGLIAGVGLFRLPRLRRVLDPLVTSYYAVPIFMFYPMFIVFFGLNRIPLIATGFVFSVVAMMVNVLNGLECVPPVLLKTARVHRMSRIGRNPLHHAAGEPALHLYRA